MPITTSDLGSVDRRDDLETTEPDFWLEDPDLWPENAAEASDAGDPAFYEAKTDPRRPTVDAFANTLPDDDSDDARYRPRRSREEALESFLETVRRVFGKGSDAE